MHDRSIIHLILTFDPINVTILLFFFVYFDINSMFARLVDPAKTSLKRQQKCNKVGNKQNL